MTKIHNMLLVSNAKKINSSFLIDNYHFVVNMTSKVYNFPNCVLRCNLLVPRGHIAHLQRRVKLRRKTVVTKDQRAEIRAAAEGMDIQAKLETLLGLRRAIVAIRSRDDMIRHGFRSVSERRQDQVRDHMTRMSIILSTIPRDVEQFNPEEARLVATYRQFCREVIYALGH